ncbi:unnamed protein product [Lota lota]
MERDELTHTKPALLRSVVSLMSSLIPHRSSVCLQRQLPISTWGPPAQINTQHSSTLQSVPIYKHWSLGWQSGAEDKPQARLQRTLFLEILNSSERKKMKKLFSVISVKRKTKE